MKTYITALPYKGNDPIKRLNEENFPFKIAEAMFVYNPDINIPQPPYIVIKIRVDEEEIILLALKHNLKFVTTKIKRLTNFDHTELSKLGDFSLYKGILIPEQNLGLEL